MCSPGAAEALDWDFEVGLALPTVQLCTQLLRAVQDGVEHAVGPPPISAGQRVDAREDGVAVSLALRHDGERKRSGVGRDQAHTDLLRVATSRT